MITELDVLLMPTTLGGYFAQVMQYDLAADGKDMECTLMELARVLNVHVAMSKQLGTVPFLSLDPAPAIYTPMWDRAVPVNLEIPDLRVLKTLPPDVKIHAACR